MKNTFNQSEVAQIVGVTRDTIRAHLKKGRVSAVLDVNGNKRLERSELMRVYGDDLDFSRIEKSGKKPTSQHSQGTSTANNSKISELEAMLTYEQNERDRERKQHEKEIERLAGALDKSQEGHNRATLLLENHSQRGGDWERAIDALKTETANAQKQAVREIQQLKERMKKRESQLKDALTAERSKTLWRKIWE